MLDVSALNIDEYEQLSLSQKPDQTQTWVELTVNTSFKAGDGGITIITIIIGIIIIITNQCICNYSFFILCIQKWQRMNQFLAWKGHFILGLYEWLCVFLLIHLISNNKQWVNCSIKNISNLPEKGSQSFHIQTIHIYTNGFGNKVSCLYTLDIKALQSSHRFVCSLVFSVLICRLPASYCCLLTLLHLDVMVFLSPYIFTVHTFVPGNKRFAIIHWSLLLAVVMID